MLELAVLGLLKERDMHGYELRQQLSQKLGFFWTVSFGSLYPTLRRLERRGAVEKVAGGETASRRRKQVYRITEQGEQEFLELLAGGGSSGWEQERFPLRVAFFRYLRPEMRIRLLERRKVYLQERSEEMRRSLSRAQRGRADSYTLALMRHGLETTRADIAWLDELIRAESGAPADAADPERSARQAEAEPAAESGADQPGGGQPPPAERNPATLHKS